MQGFLCDAPPACSRLDGMRAHRSIEKIPKILLVALAFVFGAYRWQEGTEELRARLDPSARARAPRAPATGLAATPATSPRAE